MLLVSLLLPTGAGLLGTLLQAWGWPGTLDWSAGFGRLFAESRLAGALLISLVTGSAATLLVFALAVLVLMATASGHWRRWLGGWLPPILAVPHAALAVGVVLLLSPGGWLVRAVSPAMTGWLRPPDYWLVPDPAGLTLILVLVLKETPFLLLTMLTQLPALGVQTAMTIGRTLGYSPSQVWIRLIVPQLYPRIRLILVVILVFNFGVVDLAIIAGPDSPPPLAVLVLELAQRPGTRAAGAAGALLLAALTLLAYGVLCVIEKLASAWLSVRRLDGRRRRHTGAWRSAGRISLGLLIALTTLALLVLIIQSVAWRWRFPDLLPEQYSITHWLLNRDHLLSALSNTLLLAVATGIWTTISAVAWLELERAGYAPRLDKLWYLPLLVPQLVLLTGWQTAALYLHLDTHWLTVVHAHWLYAFPYAMLLLATAWRDQDVTWLRAAQSLGSGYWRTLWRVTLPLHLPQLAQVFAVAGAVSVALYLPTLLLGGGRHLTLALDLVASTTGADARLMALLAMLQALMPLLLFAGVVVATYRHSTTVGPGSEGKP